jgi:hypothetical protein
MRVTSSIIRGIALLALLPMLWVEGCGGARPSPEVRWRFVGGAALELQTNAPVLASFLQLPQSIAIRPQLISNTAALWWRLAGSPGTGTGTDSAQALASARDMLPELLDGLSLGQTVTGKNGRREFAVAFPVAADRAAAWEKSWSNFFSLARPDKGHPQASYQQGWLVAVSDSDALDLRQTRKDLAVIPAEPGTALRIETAGALPASTARFVVDGGMVKTELKLQTKTAFTPTRANWEIPDLIRFPFVKFTAVRDAQPWFREFSWLKGLSPGAVPTQAFLWCQPSNTPYSSFQTYFSGRVAQPEIFLKSASEEIQSVLHPTNKSVALKFNLEANTNNAGFVIKGFPYVTPRFYPEKQGSSDFVMAGMWVPSVMTNPIPARVLEAIQQTNLVYYDWEVTTATTGHWNALTQVYGMAHNKLPRGRPGNTWLTTSLTGSITSLTEGVVTGPREITFHRSSPIGITSAEMAFIATWLDWDSLPARSWGKSNPNP